MVEERADQVQPSPQPLPEEDGQPKPAPGGRRKGSKAKGDPAGDATRRKGKEYPRLAPSSKDQAAVDVDGGVFLLQSFAKVREGRVRWLWPNRFPLGEVVNIQGRTSVGKTTLACAVIAHATGGPRLDCGKPRLVGDALIVCTERGLGGIKKRLRAAGADLKRCHFIVSESSPNSAARLILPGSRKKLANTIKQKGIVVVFIDPISSCFSGEGGTSKEEIVRPALEALVAVADETGCLILFSQHIRKDTSGGLLAAGLGAVAFINVPSLVLRIENCEKFGKGWHCLFDVKIQLPMLSFTHAFSIQKTKIGPRIEWLGEVEAEGEALAEDQGSVGERDTFRDAERTLANIIGDDWVLANECLKAGAEAGIGERTLRDAKSTLGIPSKHRKGDDGKFHWWWGPPKGGWPNNLEPQAKSS